MLGVTLFGLFLTPVFYVTLRKLSRARLHSHDEENLRKEVEVSHAHI
jgi:hypothetical protein